MLPKTRQTLVGCGLVLSLLLAPAAMAAPSATESPQSDRSGQTDEVAWQWPSWLSDLIDVFFTQPTSETPELVMREEGEDPPEPITTSEGVIGTGMVVDPNGI